MDINHDARQRFVGKVRMLLGSLEHKLIGVLGLSFKPNTDDMREAPSLEIIQSLQADGAHVKAYDPVAMENADNYLPTVTFCATAYDVAKEADALIQPFQHDASREANIFHHLITLPTYHTTALSTDNLAKRYFGEEAMLGYVKNVQREEIRQQIACVKHQNMAGSDMGDDHKEYFAGDAALKAGGKDNTMNQFD